MSPLRPGNPTMSEENPTTDERITQLEEKVAYLEAKAKQLDIFEDVLLEFFDVEREELAMLTDLEEIAGETRQEFNRLNTAKADGGSSDRSKVERCKQLVADELHRRAKNGKRPSIDTLETISLFDREYDEDIHHRTILDAFQQIEKSNDRVEFTEGKPGPNTPSPRVTISQNGGPL